MPTNALSGIQMIVSSLDASNFKDTVRTPSPDHFPVTFHDGEREHCCACGGPLTAQRYSARETVSGSWVTSQEFEAKDEDGLCSACKWFLTGFNRSKFMPPDAFVIFDGKRTQALDAHAFRSFLERGFDEPCIIAYCGKSLRLRKNTAWKLNRTISYSSQDVKVSLLGVNFGSGLYDGTVTFDAKDMLSCIDSLLPIVKQYRALASGFIPTAGGQYFYVLTQMVDYFRCQRGNWSEETFFAIYMACNLVFPLKERLKKQK